MSVAELAQRLAALEVEVSALKQQIKSEPPKKDWRSTVGMFTGDEVFAEMVREGRKYREQQRDAEAE